MENVNEFKNVWMEKVYELRNQAVSFLDSEIGRVKKLRESDPVNLDLLRELEAICEVKEMVMNQDYSFRGLSSPKELLAAFPTILLPAPHFVSLCRRLY